MAAIRSYCNMAFSICCTICIVLMIVFNYKFTEYDKRLALMKVKQSEAKPAEQTN